MCVCVSARTCVCLRVFVCVGAFPCPVCIRVPSQAWVAMSKTYIAPHSLFPGFSRPTVGILAELMPILLPTYNAGSQVEQV